MRRLRAGIWIGSLLLACAAALAACSDEIAEAPQVVERAAAEQQQDAPAVREEAEADEADQADSASEPLSQLETIQALHADWAAQLTSFEMQLDVAVDVEGLGFAFEQSMLMQVELEPLQMYVRTEIDLGGLFGGLMGDPESEDTDGYTEDGESEDTDGYAEDGESEDADGYAEDGESEDADGYAEDGESEDADGYAEDGESEDADGYAEDGESEDADGYAEDGESEAPRMAIRMLLLEEGAYFSPSEEGWLAVPTDELFGTEFSMLTGGLSEDSTAIMAAQTEAALLCAAATGGSVTEGELDGAPVWIVSCDVDIEAMAALLEVFEALGQVPAGVPGMPLDQALDQLESLAYTVHIDQRSGALLAFDAALALSGEALSEGEDSSRTTVHTSGRTTAWNQPIEFPTPEPLIEADSGGVYE